MHMLMIYPLMLCFSSLLTWSLQNPISCSLNEYLLHIHFILAFVLVTKVPVVARVKPGHDKWGAISFSYISELKYQLRSWCSKITSLFFYNAKALSEKWSNISAKGLEMIIKCWSSNPEFHHICCYFFHHVLGPWAYGFEMWGDRKAQQQLVIM